MKRLVFLSVLAAVLPGAPARAAAVEDADARKSLEALYDLDYDAAIKHIGAHIDRRPDDPFGYLFEAGVLWWRESAEPGLFRSNRGLKKSFKRDLSWGRKLAKRRFGSGDARARADAYFISGLILGIQAQWRLSHGRWLKAYFDGRKGKKHQQRSLEADPQHYDAYLGIGLFEYLAGRLPGILKIGAYLLIHGDAEKGKKYLQLAADKGRYRFAATQASSNLVSLYITYEDDSGRALKALRPLLKEFPTSPYFRFIEVMLLDQQGDWKGSHAKALALYRGSARDPALLRRKRMSMLCGVNPARCLKPKTLEPVIKWLTRAIDAPGPAPKGWRALCRLYRGVALDIIGRRPQALADYGAVRALPAVADSHVVASRCEKKACRRRVVVRMLKSSAFGTGATR